MLCLFGFSHRSHVVQLVRQLCKQASLPLTRPEAICFLCPNSSSQIFITASQRYCTPNMSLADFDFVKDRFEEADADIEVECAPIVSSQPDTEPARPTFKAHVNKLAAISPVFADMVAVSATSAAVEEASVADSLPKVRLDEAWSIVHIILGYAYNDEDIIEFFMATSHPLHAFQVYEAAKKYQMHGLAALASTILRSVSGPLSPCALALTF
jgi:hypothetical protein